MQRINIHSTNHILEDVPCPSMPKNLSWGVVSSVKGKILVYGIREEDRICRLQVYDPKSNFWTEVLSEEDPQIDHMTLKMLKPLFPMVVEHNGSCYRVMFKIKFKAEGMKIEYPIVHRLKVDKEFTSVEVGEEEIQQMIPVNLIGAFQMEDDLFVCCGRGSVMKTGIKAFEDTCKNKVDLGRWGDFLMCRQIASNSVLLKFDSRLVTGTGNDR